MRGSDPWLTILLLPSLWACNIVLCRKISGKIPGNQLKNFRRGLRVAASDGGPQMLARSHPCPDRWPDRLPSRALATFRPKTAALGRQQRPQERPKTGNIGTRAAQDRQHRPQERPKIGNIGPGSHPRPPTEGPRAAQDRPRGRRSRSRSRNKHIFKSATFFAFFGHIGTKSGPRPPT